MVEGALAIGSLLLFLLISISLTHVTAQIYFTEHALRQTARKYITGESGHLSVEAEDFRSKFEEIARGYGVSVDGSALRVCAFDDLQCTTNVDLQSGELFRLGYQFQTEVMFLRIPITAQLGAFARYEQF